MIEPDACAALRRRQRLTVALLVVGGTVNYFDRSALAIANPLIRQELGLSIEQMGILLSAFLWAYAFAQLPLGALVDRYGPRRVLGGGMLFWSLAQIAAGFTQTLGQLTLARALLGVGESSAGPSAQRATAAWFAPGERGKATGMWNSVSSLGPALAPPLLTALMLAWGWRWMFASLGVAGVLLGMLWFALYREPAAARTAEAGADDAVSTRAGTAQRGSAFERWLQLFSFRSTWGLMLGYFGLVYMAWLWQAWLPGYLELQRHMSIAKTGVIAAIPFAFGIVGSLLGGWVADRLARAGWPLALSRKLPLLVGMAGTAACTALVTQAQSDEVAVACIAGALFFTGASSAAAWMLASFVAPAHACASLTAIQTFGGFIGGALAPMATGFIVQATQRFDAALFLSAAIGLLCCFSYLLLVRNHPLDRSDGA